MAFEGGTMELAGPFKFDRKAYKDYNKLLERHQKKCKGKDKAINAIAKGPVDGLKKLDGLIRQRIAKLHIADHDKPAAQHIISDFLLQWPRFQRIKDPVVETWGLIWAYRTDNELAWSLKVIWNTDCPDPGTADPDKGQLPHFGYEIQFCKGPGGGLKREVLGHVFFTDTQPSYSRDNWPKHEVERSKHHSQTLGGYRNSSRAIKKETRLDYAFRLWGLGADPEVLHSLKDDKGYYPQAEYQRYVERPPGAWDLYERPCFGLPKEADSSTGQ